MENYRECIIDGCTHYVPPQNEVDIAVGIMCSTETPICEDCYMSENPEIQKQIKEANEIEQNGANGLPF